MNARLKLNSANINGAFVLAALFGWLSGSWLIFVLIAAALIGLATYSGNIRTTPKYNAARRGNRR